MLWLPTARIRTQHACKVHYRYFCLDSCSPDTDSSTLIAGCFPLMTGERSVRKQGRRNGFTLLLALLSYQAMLVDPAQGCVALASGSWIYSLHLLGGAAKCAILTPLFSNTAQVQNSRLSGKESARLISSIWKDMKGLYTALYQSYEYHWTMVSLVLD